MNDRRRAFVDAYVLTGNAAEAARRAGYSERTARAQGHRLLTDADIRAAIDAAQDDRAERLGITVDRWERELCRIAFADARKVGRWAGEVFQAIPSDELDEETAAAIQSVTQGRDGVTVRLGDKLRALELLGKRHGWLDPEQGREVRVIVEHVEEAIERRDAQSVQQGHDSPTG